MSIKMLSDITGHERQTIEDDMESLLYVVLYCALLWLPHNLPDDEVSETYTRFFEFSTIHSGASVGGDAKAANAYNRRYTRDIVFDCTAVKTWLDTVMDFCSPRDPSEKGKWTPSLVDTFWSNFLDTEVLDCHGRVAHHIRRKQPREVVSSDEDSVSSSSTDSSESLAESLVYPSTLIHPPSDTRQSPHVSCAVQRTIRTPAVEGSAPRPKRTQGQHLLANILTNLLPRPQPTRSTIKMNRPTTRADTQVSPEPLASTRGDWSSRSIQ